MSGRWIGAIALACLASGACEKGGSRAADSATTATAAPTTVAGTRIAAPRTGPPGEWPMPAADYANSRYSELAEITPANAGGLHAAWTFSTGVLRGTRDRRSSSATRCTS